MPFIRQRDTANQDVVPGWASTRRRWRSNNQFPVVAVIAIGGGLGALARYGAGVMWPTPDGGFPWTTLTVNALGCGLIGMLMVVITEIRSAHPLARPFLGTGVLGGFTTFSTYAVDIHHLVEAGHFRTGLVYLVATVAAALLAVWMTAAGTRRMLAIRRKR